MSRTRFPSGGGAADWNTIANKPTNYTELGVTIAPADIAAEPEIAAGLETEVLNGSKDWIPAEPVNMITKSLGLTYNYPTEGTFDGTIYNVAAQAGLVAALTAASNGDIINLVADITLTATLVVNKRVKFTGAFALQSAGLGTDPVTLISITAAGVCFSEEVIVKHLKSTNTSVEVAINLNAQGLVFAGTLQYVEFGMIARGSFSFTGDITYVGPTGNSNRAIAIYKLSGDSKVDGTVFDYTTDATPRANFVFVSYAAAGDLFDYNLTVANCKQASLTKVSRQFIFFEVLGKTVGATPSLMVFNNSFNCLNGDVGFMFADGQDLSFWQHLVLISNYSGNAAYLANSYKGLCFCDGAGTARGLGSTVVYAAGNTNCGIKRTANDYTLALAQSVLAFRNTLFTNSTPVSKLENLQNPSGSIYNFIRQLDRKLDSTCVQEFADNAAAKTGGLIDGELYRTGDTLKIVHS